MKTYSLLTFVLLIGTALVLADDPPSGPAPAILQPIEDKYSTEAAKAEAILSKAEAEAAKVRKSAAEARLKAYKDRLVEVTKTGDFDKASAVKARIMQLEIDSEELTGKALKRPRPKDLVKFGGHTYALIREPTTWYVAKQRCEEMGGTLVCINSIQEAAFVAKLAGSGFASIGATDEPNEGEWLNIDGSKLVAPNAAFDNYKDIEHWLVWDGKNFVDWHAGGRGPYICEWVH